MSSDIHNCTKFMLYFAHHFLFHTFQCCHHVLLEGTLYPGSNVSISTLNPSPSTIAAGLRSLAMNSAICLVISWPLFDEREIFACDTVAKLSSVALLDLASALRHSKWGWCSDNAVASWCVVYVRYLLVALPARHMTLNWLLFCLQSWNVPTQNS